MLGIGILLAVCVLSVRGGAVLAAPAAPLLAAHPAPVVAAAPVYAATAYAAPAVLAAPAAVSYTYRHQVHHPVAYGAPYVLPYYSKYAQTPVRGKGAKVPNLAARKMTREAGDGTNAITEGPTSSVYGLISPSL